MLLLTSGLLPLTLLAMLQAKTRAFSSPLLQQTLQQRGHHTPYSQLQRQRQRHMASMISILQLRLSLRQGTAIRSDAGPAHQWLASPPWTRAGLAHAVLLRLQHPCCTACGPTLKLKR